MEGRGSQCAFGCLPIAGSPPDLPLKRSLSRTHGTMSTHEIKVCGKPVKLMAQVAGNACKNSGWMLAKPFTSLCRVMSLTHVDSM